MSGNRREEDFEVPWPAFVDLLTSVLITFMFFILITTVAMSTMTMKTVEDMSKNQTEKKEDAAAAAKTPADSPMLAPPSEVAPVTEAEEANLKAENESLKEELIQAQQKLAAMNAPLNRATEITTQKETKSLTLVFKRNEIGMLPATSTAIKDLLTSGGKISGVKLIAVEPMSLSISQAREQALARALNVRNVIIAEGISAKNISIQYVPTKAVFNSTDWVRIELR